MLNSGDLSRDQKIEILRRWEYDARELQVAEEENMIGTNADILGQIMRALLQLDEESEVDRLEHSHSSKQGGRVIATGKMSAIRYRLVTVSMLETK